MHCVVLLLLLWLVYLFCLFGWLAGWLADKYTIELDAGLRLDSRDRDRAASARASAATQNKQQGSCAKGVRSVVGRNSRHDDKSTTAGMDQGYEKSRLSKKRSLVAGARSD